MIYTNLKGGLGNMLFQISATISLALDNDNQWCFPNLKHHINYLNGETTHNENLNHGLEYLKIFKNLNNCTIIGNPTYIQYPFNYTYIPFNQKEIIIDGFFQSEKYFKHNRKKILKVLDFSFIDREKILLKYDLMDKKKTSIHVRRGDYLKFPNHHPIQSTEYYDKAIELLKNSTELFVIFSDDIDWCKKNLKLNNVVYVEGEKDYNELYLMSLCDNNIISNSSFSWWGAWLNNNDEKIVIGPSKWFGSAIQHNTGDILPEKWIKI